MGDIVKKNANLLPPLMKEVEGEIVGLLKFSHRLREKWQKTLLDFLEAALYGVETKRVNEAVRNNPRKFPRGLCV